MPKKTTKKTVTPEDTMEAVLLKTLQFWLKKRKKAQVSGAPRDERRYYREMIHDTIANIRFERHGHIFSGI